MSTESMLDLNANVLIGNTDQRGTAWHYRADLQGHEPNHYPGPIPVEDVRRRLFHWQAEARRVAVETPADLATMTHISDDGTPARWVVQPDRQAVARSDDHDGIVLGLFKDGYQMHQYDQWLLTTVADILDDTLCISSAGLLKKGAVAWVEVSVPETITTPEGFDFRPNLLATTSFDGSIATTFKRTVTATVCDNTRELALAEQGQGYKVKHSRYSVARLAEAREALAMIHTLADDFTAEVQTLTRMTVTDQQWEQFVDAHIPVTDPRGLRLTGRSLTVADNKRDTLRRLYRTDLRVAPWAGTALGVLQAVNTAEHHEWTVRGMSRAERNALRTVQGDFATVDRDAMQRLTAVLAA